MEIKKFVPKTHLLLSNCSLTTLPFDVSHYVTGWLSYCCQCVMPCRGDQNDRIWVVSIYSIPVPFTYSFPPKKTIWALTVQWPIRLGPWRHLRPPRAPPWASPSLSRRTKKIAKKLLIKGFLTILVKGMAFVVFFVVLHELLLLLWVFPCFMHDRTVFARNRV